MKLKNIAMSACLLSALALTSCSAGQYWDKADNLGEAYAFAKPGLTVVVPEDATFPTSYDVTINRTEAGPEVTVPVKFTALSDCLSGPDQVTFKAGEKTATYTVSIDTSLVKAGPTYSATIQLEQPEDILLEVNANNLKLAFNIRQTLTLIWEDAGTAAVTSAWVENETPATVPVQEAVNYYEDNFRLFRLVSPYYYMEPDFAEEGYDIQFICRAGSLYKAYSLPSGWQAIGEQQPLEDGTLVNMFIGMPDNGETYSFASQKNRYIINCAIGYYEDTNPAENEVNVLDDHETLSFTWTH